MNPKIEDIDRRIIELISERARLHIEDIRSMPVGGYSPAERARLREIIDRCNTGPLSGDLLMKVYTEIVSGSMALGGPLSAAYFGPAGTFTHIALLEIFGESITAIPYRTIPEVFQQVESGSVTCGVVPVENSTEGAVTYTLDEFLDTDLMIVSEKFLRISHNLVSLCDDVKKIKKLYSHPQPLGQCKQWLRENLPGVETIQVGSTSTAAETASWDKYSAAIASEVSAKLNGLNVLASGIEDSRHNYTRFLVIGRSDSAPTGKDKTSIVCAIRDRAGALYDMLRPFHDAKINMTRIESRPDKKKMWEYNFFIDFAGHRDDTVVKNALDAMKESTLFLKILGSYPAGS
jgi:chorismate mutase/prephenate dehydratase